MTARRPAPQPPGPKLSATLSPDQLRLIDLAVDAAFDRAYSLHLPTLSGEQHTHAK